MSWSGNDRVASQFRSHCEIIPLTLQKEQATNPVRVSVALVDLLTSLGLSDFVNNVTSRLENAPFTVSGLTQLRCPLDNPNTLSRHKNWQIKHCIRALRWVIMCLME